MQKIIKLLHITSSLRIGGAEAVLCDIIRKLGNQEFEHHVIYFHEGPNLDKIKLIGVNCYKIGGAFCLYDPVFFVKLLILVKKLNPDVIHSLLWSANISSRLIAKLLRINNVSVYHNDICIYSKLQKVFDKLTINFSNLIVAVSKDVERSIEKYGYNFKNKNKLKIIENGIDFVEISNNENIVYRQDLDIKQEDFVIGTVGRFSPEKNIGLLIRSFAKICKFKDSVKLVIVGIGPQEDFLKNLVIELGISDKVKFIIGQKACNYYNLFDCFVQSSAKEGMSIALLEAMSFELPCVVTNPDKQHCVIRDLESGLVVVGQNEQELCNSIIKLIENCEFSISLAANAKNIVLEDFAIEKMVQKYRDVFVDLYLLSNSNCDGRR